MTQRRNLNIVSSIFFGIMALCFAVDENRQYLDFLYFFAEYGLPIYLINRLLNYEQSIVYFALKSFYYAMIVFITVEYIIGFGQPRALVFAYYLLITSLIILINKKWA